MSDIQTDTYRDMDREANVCNDTTPSTPQTTDAAPDDASIARTAADEIIDWIAGPVPWQEWERKDMADRIHLAIKQAKGEAPTQQNISGEGA